MTKYQIDVTERDLINIANAIYDEMDLIRDKLDTEHDYTWEDRATMLTRLAQYAALLERFAR